MACTCSSLAEIEKVENHAEFFRSLPVIATGNWVRLCRCQECAQFWSVDEWDKYQIAFARKLAGTENWEEVSVEAQKRYLLRSRGIQEGVACIQAGCHKPALNGVVFCLDHLYRMGWRE